MISDQCDLIMFCIYFALSLGPSWSSWSRRKARRERSQGKSWMGFPFYRVLCTPEGSPSDSSGAWKTAIWFCCVL